MIIDNRKEKNIEEVVRGRKKRLKELSDRGLVFLQEAKTLLTQLKRGGVILYPVTENEIRGLDHNKISNIYMLLNRVYDGFLFDYNDERYSEEELVGSTGGKPAKVIHHLKFNSDMLENLVFSLAEVKDAGRGSYERCYVEGQLLDLATKEIDEVLGKLEKVSKKTITISGLRKPIRWEDITIIHIGESIKVKQNDTMLGVYKLTDLGIPKLRKVNIGKGVQPFLLSLFFSTMELKNNLLLSTNTINQKTKSNLSKILKDAFDTNEDPIRIDTKTKMYTAIFNTSTGEEMAINNYYSGKKYLDKDGDFNSTD